MPVAMSGSRSMPPHGNLSCFATRLRRPSSSKFWRFGALQKAVRGSSILSWDCRHLYANGSGDYGVRKAMSVTADPHSPASSWKVVRGDFFGGVAAGVAALPLALAFGVASGLGPVAGLYGAIATGIVAAVFGGTPVQITGPTGPMTLVVAGVLATNMLPSGVVDLPAVVGIFVLAGLAQIALGLFR